MPTNHEPATTSAMKPRLAIGAVFALVLLAAAPVQTAGAIGNPTPASQAAKALASDYFGIGNGIVAFYIPQKLVFLNALHKETALAAVIRAHRYMSVAFVWIFALGYAGVLWLVLSN